jgi:hypothetical protein
MTHLFCRRYHPFVPFRCHPSLLVFTVSARPHLLSLSLLVVAALSCWLLFLSPSPVLVLASRLACPHLFLLHPFSFTPLSLLIVAARSCWLTLTCTQSCWSSSGLPLFVCAAPALVHAAVLACCCHSLLLAIVLAHLPSPALDLADPRPTLVHSHSTRSRSCSACPHWCIVCPRMAVPALVCTPQPLVYVCIKYIVIRNNIIILLTFIQ